MGWRMKIKSLLSPPAGTFLPGWVAALAAAYAALALPAVWQQAMPSHVILISAALAAALIALSVIDLMTFRLPDALTLPLTASGIILAGILNWDSFGWRTGAAIIGFCSAYGVARLYEAVRGQSGLGLGDAKLFSASGAWVGAGGLASVLLYACLTALLAALAEHVRQARSGRSDVSMSTAIPFGPFLAAGTWLVWLYGPIA